MSFCTLSGFTVCATSVILIQINCWSSKSFMLSFMFTDFSLPSFKASAKLVFLFIWVFFDWRFPTCNFFNQFFVFYISIGLPIICIIYELCKLYKFCLPKED